MSKLFFSAVALSTSFALATAAEAGVIGVQADHSQFLFGTGRGVKVGVVDSGIDENHPTLRGSVLKSKALVGNNANDNEGHGTAVASLIAGNHPNFRGAAPDAQLLNARWSTASEKANEPFRGTLWATNQGAEVVNMSWGAGVPHPRRDLRNVILDYLTEEFKTTYVIAAGNSATSALRDSPGGAYNGINVGALEASGTSWNRVTSFSNRALVSDVRTKPEVVAPGQSVKVAAHDWENGADYTFMDGTSFSAPIVAGVAAQMIGWAKENDQPTNPTLIKAILMTTAVKVHDDDGKKWKQRSTRITNEGVTQFTRSIDNMQGAGRIQAVHAYHVFNKSFHDDQVKGDWKLGKMERQETRKLDLGQLQEGNRVDATLAWLRHVSWDDEDGDNKPDMQDNYEVRAPLADFVLRLFRGDELVAEANSSDDNFEHISWLIEQDGDYELRVRRLKTGGIKNEEFALAARVLDDPPVLNNIGASSLFAMGPASLNEPVGGFSARGMLTFPAYVGSAGATVVPEPAGAGLLILLIPLLRRRRQV